jgi:hypothetical protein
MKIFEMLTNWWYRRSRKFDMDLLWPECCRQASDLDSAKAAFGYHAFNDPAWLHLGNKGIFMIIDSLQCPEGSFAGTGEGTNKSDATDTQR